MRRASTKIIILILLGVFISFITPSISAKQEITIDLWGLVESRIYVGTFAAIKEFENRTGIKVQVGTPGGQGDLDPQKLITAVVAHTPPDVIWFGRHNMGMWAPRGAFLALDDLIKRDGIDLSEYYPGTIGESQWEGKTYAIPWNVDCRVLFANMKMLRKAGFNQLPKTWDELEKMAVALTKYDKKKGYYEVLGFAPNYGNAWLYLYGWQNGAKWISSDGRKALFTEPEVVEALEWMVHCYDAVGGAKNVQAFQNSAQVEGIGNPFLSERLAMYITGNYDLDYVARLRPDLDLKVAPPPMPRKGMQEISWSGGFSWVIPKEAKHPDEAWEFAKWMNSEEAWIIQAEAQIRYARKEEGEKALYVPFYCANRLVNEKITDRYMKDLPENIREGNRICLDLLPYCKFRPVSPVSAELWDAQANAILDAIFHICTPKQTLEIQQRRVQTALDRFFTRPEGKVLSEKKIVLFISALILIFITIALTAFIKGLRYYRKLGKKKAFEGLLYVLPWIIGFFIFIIGPMIFSAIAAFTQYDVIHQPEFIGFKNWIRMFGFHKGEMGMIANDPQVWKSLQNTIYMTLFGVPIGMFFSLSIALLLNKNIKGVGIYRTLYYVPVMVPVVAAALIWVWLLNPETGLLNYVLRFILAPIGLKPPSWFVDAKWAKPGLILMMVWGCGGTVIIWLAGLKTLPRHLYESAMIDGANVWRQFRHITLPLLTPYILFIWIMGTIGSLQIFTQAYIIGAPGDAMLFYVLYLFFRAFRYFEMGYACAMAWILFIITVIICLWQIRVSRKWVYYEAGL